MTAPAIRVHQMSKRYRLGGVADASFREMIAGVARRTLRRFTAPAADSPRDLWALRDVSFDVQPGEVIGIIGRNGAGKSTLLKILSRITDPTAGYADIRGRVGSLLEVGTGFHPELTGRENIFLNGTLLGMRRGEVAAHFDAIVDFSGVERFLDTPVKRYSSGMRLRLAFAVAAHLEPEVLIIDEVLAVGDAAFQQKCLGKMKEVAAGQGRTVLFVSHNMAAVQQLTTRCVWLAAGRVVEDGPSAQVVGHYLAAQQSAAAADTRHAPRSGPHLGQVARITRITPRPADTVAFRFGETLEFDVDLEAAADLTGLRLGVTLLELGGGAVLTTVTPHRVALDAGGTRTLRLRVPNSRLAPGTYAIGLSVGRGGLNEPRTELDVVREGPAFSVTAVGDDGDALFNWRRDYGSVVGDHAEVETLDSTILQKVA